MAIASLSFSAALPTYNSIGSNGTIFARNAASTRGDVTVNTNGASASGNATVLTSGLTSNGLNYTPQSVSVSGNKLTVIYGLSTGETANDETARQTLQAGDQGAALAGGLYGRGVTITPEGSQTNGYTTTTAYRLSINGPVNNIFGTSNQQSGLSVSTSSDGSRISVESIAALGNGLSVVYQLSDAAPATNTEDAAPASGSADTGNTGLPASLKGISTIGDLLASASGLSFNGTLTGALQAQNASQSTGVPHSGSVLAAVLSPSLNLSPSTSLNVSNFINTSANAFPTSAPPSPPPPADNPFALPPAGGSSVTSSSGGTTGTDSFSGQNSSSSQGGAATGFYNALANTGASTIRGSSLNVVA